MSLLRAIAVLVGVILIGACTTLRNTPQQDLVWSAYNQCKAEGRIPTNVQFVRVEPDGRASYSTYSSAYGRNSSSAASRKRSRAARRASRHLPTHRSCRRPSVVQPTPI